MKYLPCSAVLLMLFISCTKVKDKAKDTLNEGGEIVGKAVTEVAEGITEGVDRTLDCTLKLSPDLKARGLHHGKFSVESDSGGSNNKLSVYLITDSAFSDTLFLKVYDKTGAEMGRMKQHVWGNAGDAKFHDFVFDKRTHIEVRSRIEIN
jgi:hypothetical protein